MQEDDIHWDRRDGAALEEEAGAAGVMRQADGVLFFLTG